jgi:hypothetical protein
MLEFQWWLMLVTEEYGYDLGCGFPGVSKTINRCIALQIQGAEVQLCLVRGSYFYYFMLCSTWLELCLCFTLA